MIANQTAEQIYERLKQKAAHVTIDENTYTIVEGDLRLDDTELFAYAVRRAAALNQPPLEIKPEPLVAVTDDSGRLVRWKKGLLLTYAVLRSTFSTQAQYESIVQGMREATAAWEAACGINFKYCKEFDGQPYTAGPSPDVIFRVALVNAGGEFIAMAFFPNQPPSRRMVYIDPSYFSPHSSFDPVGVLRHELGHVLGFRHEHIRPDAPTGCREEDLTNTANLTPFDSHSVMHYLCGGAGDPKLNLTDYDRQGARHVYGPPDSEVTYCT